MKAAQNLTVDTAGSRWEAGPDPGDSSPAGGQDPASREAGQDMGSGARLRPAVSSRVQRKRGQRVAQIIKTAAELFGERGYDDVSLDDVAERLDVTKGLLYYYFASKDDLAAAAIETLGNEWTTRLQELPDALDGPADARLEAIIRAHLRIAVVEYPAALRVFLVPHPWPPAHAMRIKELRRRHDEVFRSVLKDGVASGEFTVVSIPTTLQCMHAAMTHAPLWCGSLDPAARDRAIDELTATLMMLVGQAPS
jgi:AcrR family transcriptional regulator